MSAPSLSSNHLYLTWVAVMLLPACGADVLYGRGADEDPKVGRPPVLPTCTATSKLDNPARILLLIDTSKSMETNDPNSGRTDAAKELVSNVSSEHPDADIAFAVVTFDTYASQITDGFVNAGPALERDLDGLGRQEGFTNYVHAFQEAAELVEVESGKMLPSAPAWFYAYFLSDGIPRLVGGTVQSDADIMWAVERLLAPRPGSAGLTLNTAFLGSVGDAARPHAEVLLQSIAETGGGDYASFEHGDALDFSVLEQNIIDCAGVRAD